MTDRLRSIVKVVASEVNKNRLLNDSLVTFGNATEKAKERLNNVQSVVASKYDTMVKQINNNTTIVQDLRNAHMKPRTPMPHVIVRWWQWYQQVTGLDEVELSKNQVILAQEKLFKCQDERRRLNRHVNLINDKLKEIYGELIQTKRDDPRYVQLTIIENKTLQDQAKIIGHLDLLEKEERDCFTILATAIKEYHDSQTLNAQKYKYLSIITSAIVAIVSLTGSMIYNNRRINDVRHLLAQAQKENEGVLADHLQSLANNVTTKFADMFKTSDDKDSNFQQTEPLSVAPALFDKRQMYMVLGLSFLTICFLKVLGC